MYKLVLSFLFIIFFCFVTFSQSKNDYKWIFGSSYQVEKKIVKGCIIDFKNKGRIDTADMHDGVANHNAPISDRDGNLLFYFNGCRIIDSTFLLMDNGDSINYGKTWRGYCGNWSWYPGPQNSIVLTDPGNISDGNNGYYLIHKRQELISEPFVQVSIPELYYSYIDMNSNNGRGSVIKKDQVIFKTRDLVSGYLSACKHANGKDWWLIQMEQDTKMYFKILLTKDGFKVDSQSIDESLIFTPGSGVGQAVFTPDGSKWITNSSYDESLIIDFDREDGMLSNLIRVMPQDSGIYYGVAVSPNSRFVYLSNDYDLFQVDLWANDIPESIEHIAHIDSFPDYYFSSAFGQAQLAPDCKIYIVSSTTNNYLHVINKPNEKGKACDFQQHSVYLPHRNYNNCIPNFPHFRMDEAEICDPTITSMFGEAVWYRRDLEIFPNPSSGLFNIRLPDVGPGKLVVLNLEGQLVLQRDLSNVIPEVDIDISDHSNGSYFIEFYPDKSTERIFYSAKVVKLK